MKRSVLFLASAVVLMAFCACNKPADPEPGPTPQEEEEITTNNAAPGGFTDDGPQSWYE